MSELYYLKQNAISPEEITTLIAYIKNNLTKDYRDHYQHAGILMHDFYESPDLEFQALRKVIEICRKTFIENYSFNYDKFELKRLFGNVMGQGAINEAHDDDGDRYPNKPVIEEHYSAVLMLSSDYTGGELFFQHHNKEIKLEPGDLINFAGEDFRVLEIEPSEDGWILEVLDRMEDQIDLFVPDDSVIALLEE
jgi:hypothetical protein